ncbi:hypothetical protein [Chitiniphilus eburneus]|uniref:CBM-cenC domain-containing protein n=1 Tax=Chitiniphilus eburneus TaxID=2571148 RepID=A0A4U0P3A1_9NEIS|nr:hypothetical protein [Chitiniphilus eburneus]TJZ61733.1 hypothetical protein FAZ21_19995 [Chitiniphilus eburneus]
MAARRPLVLVNGRRQQLPAGDRLPGAAVDLTGMVTADAGLVVPTDSVRDGMGKLQAQLQARSGRNLIVDGRYDLWYEGTSWSTSGYGGATMLRLAFFTASATVSRQAFAIGEIPVASAAFYPRTVFVGGSGGASHVILSHRLENVLSVAGRTVTISFYARSPQALKIALELQQLFGIGGSASEFMPIAAIPLTTDWQRYVFTAQFPSAAGKAVGPGDSWNVTLWLSSGPDFAARSSYIGVQSGTIDVACMQMEFGSVATVFDESLNYQDACTAVGWYYQNYSGYWVLSSQPYTANINTHEVPRMREPVSVIQAPNSGTGASWLVAVRSGLTTLRQSGVHSVDSAGTLILDSRL